MLGLGACVGLIAGCYLATGFSAGFRLCSGLGRTCFLGMADNGLSSDSSPEDEEDQASSLLEDGF